MTRNPDWQAMMRAKPLQERIAFAESACCAFLVSRAQLLRGSASQRRSPAQSAAKAQLSKAKDAGSAQPRGVRKEGCFRSDSRSVAKLSGKPGEDQQQSPPPSASQTPPDNAVRNGPPQPMMTLTWKHSSCAFVFGVAIMGPPAPRIDQASGFSATILQFKSAILAFSAAVHASPPF